MTDVPLLLMEFVDGEVVDRMSIARSLTPERRRAIGWSLPRTLAKIHAVDLEATGLTGLASHKPYAQRQLVVGPVGEVQDARAARPGGPHPTPRRGRAGAARTDTLARRLPSPQRHHLLRQWGATGVLDWELSTLGDPLADMGSLLASWPAKRENTSGDFVATTLDGFPPREELVAATRRRRDAS